MVLRLEGSPPGPSLAAWVAPPADPEDDPPVDETPDASESGCGCTTAPTGGSAWLLALIAAVLLRRRKPSR